MQIKRIKKKKKTKKRKEKKKQETRGKRLREKPKCENDGIAPKRSTDNNNLQLSHPFMRFSRKHRLGDKTVIYYIVQTDVCIHIDIYIYIRSRLWKTVRTDREPSPPAAGPPIRRSYDNDNNPRSIRTRIPLRGREETKYTREEKRKKRLQRPRKIVAIKRLSRSRFERGRTRNNRRSLSLSFFFTLSLSFSPTRCLSFCPRSDNPSFLSLSLSPAL